MQVRHLAYRTEQSYHDWIKRYCLSRKKTAEIAISQATKAISASRGTDPLAPTGLPLWGTGCAGIGRNGRPGRADFVRVEKWWFARRAVSRVMYRR